MKKVILGMVFVFATVTMVNAEISVEKDNFNTDVNLVSEEIIEGDFDCFTYAWDIGTEMGDGDPYLEWYYTDKYYNWCLVMKAVYPNM